MELRNNIKKLALAVACVVALGAAQQANALTIGDIYYVGSVTPGGPASEAQEVAYINQLRLLPIPLVAPFDVTIGDQIYNRQGSTIAAPAGVLADYPPNVKVESPEEGEGEPITTLDATGYNWVIAKYDADKAGSLVWYIGGAGLGEITVPLEFNGKEVSHISAYGRDPGTNTPDGGTTVALLGLGMLGLGYLSRRKD
jgi:hypothetical protein